MRLPHVDLGTTTVLTTMTALTPTPSDRTIRRVRMSRREPWRDKAPGAVIVDRSTKWGNPFRLGLFDGKVLLDVDDAVEAYARCLTGDPPRLVLDAFGHNPVRGTVEDARRELAGKDLACWCPLDAPCHASVLLDLANRAHWFDVEAAPATTHTCPDCLNGWTWGPDGPRPCDTPRKSGPRQRHTDVELVAEVLHCEAWRTDLCAALGYTPDGLASRLHKIADRLDADGGELFLWLTRRLTEDALGVLSASALAQRLRDIAHRHGKTTRKARA
jgi:hypothetical protein